MKVFTFAKPPDGKVGSLSDAESWMHWQRNKGHKIVLAHGVFDLLHLGHIRHLKQAAQHGLLVVSITADAFVNKGLGRPAFNQGYRAEALAALDCVSFVCVNEAPTSIPVIRTVSPDFYAKGEEYREEAYDITGNIRSEKEAIESCGGQIVFTKGETFSSSHLINRHLNPYPAPLQEYLDGYRAGGALERLIPLVEKIANYRVLFVGDSIVDEYIYVQSMGKTSKENLIATRYEDKEEFAGGVHAAAGHLRGFVKEVDVLTGNTTTRKTRYVDKYNETRKLFEVY
jgi:cytidyltransferase-like protein